MTTTQTDKALCAANIPDPTGWGHNHQCSRRAVVDRDGKRWCRQHDPDNVRAKAKAADEKYRTASATRREQAKRYSAHDALVTRVAELEGALERIRNASDGAARVGTSSPVVPWEAFNTLQRIAVEALRKT